MNPKGLILIGGKSSRMGTDKSQLDYHGKPQSDYLFELLSGFCEEVFFSCRNEQLLDNKHFICDTHENIGPIGGVLSAFEKYPKAAWLVVACDMPLVNEKTIELLTKNRNINKLATAFLNPENHAPEPLLTIYEASSFGFLSEYFQEGNQSLKYFLQMSDIQLINSEKIDFLININDQKAFQKFRS